MVTSGFESREEASGLGAACVPILSSLFPSFPHLSIFQPSKLIRDVKNKKPNKPVKEGRGNYYQTELHPRIEQPVLVVQPPCCLPSVCTKDSTTPSYRPYFHLSFSFPSISPRRLILRQLQGSVFDGESLGFSRSDLSLKDMISITRYFGVGEARLGICRSDCFSLPRCT